MSFTGLPTPPALYSALDTKVDIVLFASPHSGTLPDIPVISARLKDILDSFEKANTDVVSGPEIFYKPRNRHLRPFHEMRWRASRAALLYALDLFDRPALKGKRIFFSFSHCPHSSLAAILLSAKSAAMEGFGIDFEEKSRILPESVERWLMLPADHIQNLSSLDIWLAKEAVYKSLAPQGQMLLRDIKLASIEERNGTLLTGSDPEGVRTAYCALAEARIPGKNASSICRYAVAVNSGP